MELEMPHWLSETPSEFLNRTSRNRDQATFRREGDPNLSRKFRYTTFTLLFFIFREEEMLLMHREGDGHIGNTKDTARIPSERFDVLQVPDNQPADGQPTYQVKQEPVLSLRRQIYSTILKMFPDSEQIAHPTLQAAQLMQEHSYGWPDIREKLHDPDLRSPVQDYACDMEVSIVLKVDAGTIGDGPYYWWFDESSLENCGDRRRRLLATSDGHISDMIYDCQHLAVVAGPKQAP